MEVRQEIINRLHKCFLVDISKSMLSLESPEDKAYFCGTLRELVVAMYNDYANLFDEDEFVLEKLYTPLKGKLTSFKEADLLLYLHRDEDSQKELFKKTGINETRILNEDELKETFAGYLFLLTETRKRVLARTSKTEDIVVDNKQLEEAKDQLASKMPNFNRARQTLIFYYLLKGNNVQKDTHSVAAMARFVHNTLGIPYTKIDNSEFYEKLKSAPLFKKEALLLKDLEYVKEQFLSIECHELARIVEEDIKIVQKTLRWK